MEYFMYNVLTKSVLRRLQAQMPLLTERGFEIKVNRVVNSQDKSKSYEMTYIAWKQIDELMDEEELKRWNEWIRGQTVVLLGCYPNDLERFLEGKSAFR